jgi:hypothetical protein
VPRQRSMKKNLNRATFGFSVHTGWAAMIAVAGPPKAPTIVDRRLFEMMGDDPDKPRFVYHYAAERLELPAAERFVREAVEQSRSHALAALEAALVELGKKNYDVVASGIVVGNKPLKAALADILRSHSLIHTAEGELFRVAVKSASERLKIPVTEIRARDLESQAAKVLGVPAAKVPERLAAIGRAAGKPWGKDQKDSFLVAMLASAQP